jgi:hypothetical protein
VPAHDLNGDGKADLLAVNEADHHALISDGTRFWFEKWLEGHFYGQGGAYAADVTGDGYADGVGFGLDYAGVVSIGKAGFGYVSHNYDRWSFVGLLGTKGTFVADVDGDGAADAVSLFEWGVTVALSTGLAFEEPSLWLPGDFADYEAAFVADADGDGLADLIGIRPASIDVSLSDGRAFRPPATWRQGALRGKRIFVADVDGDGRADGIRLEDDRTWVARATNRGFAQDALWYTGALAGAEASFVADADGDGRADVVAVNRASVRVALSNGAGFSPPTTWYSGQFSADHNLTVAPEPSAPRGFAASPTVVGLYRPDFRWWLRAVNTPGLPGADVEYGGPGDVPVAGDWNGDWTASIGVFRPARSAANQEDGALWLLRDSNTLGEPDVPVFAHGGEGDLPVVGDWDGNGTTTVGIYRPAYSAANPTSEAWWFLRNSNSSGLADITPFAYGGPGDVPVVGDWNADWQVTIGVYRPSTGEWLLRNSNGPGKPDVVVVFGAPTDIPVVGDWDGNQTATIGLFRPPGSPLNPNPQARWLLRNKNTAGPPEIDFFWGGAGELPVTGKWRLPP